MALIDPHQRGLAQPFIFRWIVWVLIVGGACTLVLCVLADMRWGLITSNGRLLSSMAVDSAGSSGIKLGLEQSSQFPTGSVKTLFDFVDREQLPHDLLAHSDMDFCPNISEPKIDELDRIPESVKMLMLIGSQKTGTTWLFKALHKHPAFVSAIRQPGGYRVEEGSLLAKELKYFNRWPLPPVHKYLHAWEPAEIGKMMSGDANNRVLLDASPQYLMCAAAPARIQAVAPHAKFMMVVRDGPSRTFSDFKMLHSGGSCKSNPSWRICTSPSFLGQVEFELNDPQWRPECYFNGSHPEMTWADCFRCHFGHFGRPWPKDECRVVKQSGAPDIRDCRKPGHRLIDHGLYAPQLAWWLRFFPPESFLIISAWQLHDKVERIKVLNRILEFAGLSDVKRFTPDMVDNIHGFVGKYSHNFTEDTMTALGLLRDYFRKPQQDLVKLVHTFWPEDEFHIEYES